MSELSLLKELEKRVRKLLDCTTSRDSIDRSVDVVRQLEALDAHRATRESPNAPRVRR